jgi:hypothetical protein
MTATRSLEWVPTPFVRRGSDPLPITPVIPFQHRLADLSRSEDDGRPIHRSESTSFIEVGRNNSTKEIAGIAMMETARRRSEDFLRPEEVVSAPSFLVVCRICEKKV